MRRGAAGLPQRFCRGGENRAVLWFKKPVDVLCGFTLFPALVLGSVRPD